MTADIGLDAAFSEFVRSRSRRLGDLAWLITGNLADAEDAVQDALAGLYRRWAKLPTGDEFEAYVHRSLVNACLGVIRRRPRTLSVADPALLASAPVGADPSVAVAASDQVWRLCQQLAPDQRAAVVLRFYGDLSYAEIAAALGCREATARSHVNRALKKLRSRIEETK